MVVGVEVLLVVVGEAGPRWCRCDAAVCVRVGALSHLSLVDRLEVPPTDLSVSTGGDESAALGAVVRVLEDKVDGGDGAGMGRFPARSHEAAFDEVSLPKQQRALT